MTNSRVSNAMSRRSFGTAAALTTLASGMTAKPSSSLAQAVRYDNPFPTDAALVKALQKMRSNTDGSMRSGWLEAKRFAYIDGEITPLLILLAGTISTSRDNGDGTFDINLVETTYYLDVNTGELLDTLKIPGTGKTVKVPLYRSGPAVVTIGTKTDDTEVSTGEAGVIEEDGNAGSGAFAPKGNVTLERSVGPAIIDADTVWIQTEEYGRVYPTDPKDDLVFYKESAIWQGEVSELTDPNVTAASAKLSYHAATSWRPWMEMGDVQGHTMASGIGATCNSLEEMPDEWLRLTGIHHPDILDDPEGVLRGDA